MRSGKDVLFAVLPAVIGLLPSGLDRPLVPVDFINILIVLLNNGLLLVELLQDILVNLLHHLHLLQFTSNALIVLQCVLCYLFSQFLLDLSSKDVRL